MDLYSVLLFVHVLSAMALFGALAVEAVAFASLRRVDTLGEGRMWMGLVRWMGRLGPLAMVPLLVAGIWMMTLRWNAEPWVVAALSGVAAIATLAGAVTRRAMRGIMHGFLAHPELGPGGIAALVDAGRDGATARDEWGIEDISHHPSTGYRRHALGTPLISCGPRCSNPTRIH